MKEMFANIKERYSFEFMPFEIIVQILSHLDFNDIKSVSLLSKHWREAITHPIIQKKFYLNLSTAKLKRNGSIISTFSNSGLKFTELQINCENQQLEETEIYSLLISHNDILKNVKYLTISNSKLSCNSLSIIVSKMLRLSSIIIISCELNNGEISDVQKCSDVLKNLIVFKMKSSKVNSYKALLSFFVLTSKLTEFDIRCSRKQNNSENVTEAMLLSEIVLRNGLTLQKIFFKNCEKEIR